jgi:hypothetical protein
MSDHETHHRRQAILDATREIAQLLDQIYLWCEQDKEIGELICTRYPFKGSLTEIARQVIAWRDAIREASIK